MQKYTVSINIAFWNLTESERFENTLLSYQYLTMFANYCKDRGLEIQTNLFDCSPIKNKNFPKSIHLPCSNTRYNRAEKLNQVFLQVKDYDFFSVLDADVMILPSQFEQYFNVFNNLKIGRFECFKMFHIDNRNSVEDFLKINESKITGTELKHPMALGGFFVINSRDFLQSGGYKSETYLVYGAEDDDIYLRLKINQVKRKCHKIQMQHLWHPRILETCSQEDLDRKAWEYRHLLEMQKLAKRNLYQYIAPELIKLHQKTFEII